MIRELHPTTGWDRLRRWRYRSVGCLMVLFALVTPRFIMFILWVFTDYLSHAFGSFFWPLLGFFFLPTTTMAYAVAQNEFHGAKGWGLVALILGVMVDFGLLGGGGRAIGRHTQHEPT